MSTAGPGWYDDGQHPGRVRYWDGEQWTEHFASALPVAERVTGPVAFDPEYRPQHAQFPRNRRPVWPWVLAGSCIAFLVLVAVVTWLLITTVFNVANGPRQAIADFDRAWSTSDCELLRSVTTDAYASSPDYDGDICASFEEDPAVYRITIDEVAVSGAEATVLTREQWETDLGSFDEAYRYELVADGGHWRIDSYLPVDGDVSPVG